MSLNLRNSIPKERLTETESFRKNKTFEFSRANKLTNDLGGIKDFGSTLPQITELPSTGQTEEVTLEFPLKIKKKPQSTAAGEGKKAGKGKPKFNLEIPGEENNEEPKVESEKVGEEENKVEVQVEEPKKEEEKKEAEEFVLEKPFPKAGDLKKKNKRNLAIVSEDNEEQTASIDVKKGFGLSIDTSDNKPTEDTQSSQVEQVQEKEPEKVEVREDQKEPEIELALPKPKPKGKGLGMGKKKFAVAIELDVEAINSEFTIGGEKGQKNYDENELTQIIENAMKEVYRLAKECVEHMSKS